MTDVPTPDEVLVQSRVFGALDEPTRAMLEKRMELVHFAPGELICREGEAGDAMFIVARGEVVVLKKGQHDIEVEVAVLTAGEEAGSMSLLEHSVRSASLQARGEVDLWRLDKDTFNEMLAGHPDTAAALLAQLSRRLRAETDQVAQLLSENVDDRLQVAVFDTKPYTEASFRAHNLYDFALRFFEPRLTAETVPLVAGVQVVCVFVNDHVDREVIDALARAGVGMIALRCAGYNNVDLEAAYERGISVARVPAYSPYAVAEHAVALMTILNRRIHRAHNRIREGNFSLTGLVGFDMHGRTAGIVGAGKIGICLMRILHGFGCRLLVHTRTPKQELTDKLGVEFVDLDTLWRDSDIISLHAPLTPDTHHMIDADAVAKMRRGVMLINTSRGALIDSHALLDGLKTGQIGYAGLDVYEEEDQYFFEDFSDKVITDDVLARLTTFNNVMITSHQAFLTRDALENIAHTTFGNIREYEQQKRLGELTNTVLPRSAMAQAGAS